MRDVRIVSEARRLKDSGWANTAIASKLFVKESTVSRWCGEVPNPRVAKIIDAFEEKRRMYYCLDKFDAGDISRDRACLFASLLYWCEGAKYPSSNRVDFVCSDEKLVALFLNFLRVGFKVDESKFRVILQVHKDHNTKELIEHWSRLLRIPINQFRKPTVTVKNGGKYRKIYYGTCSLRYYDYSLLLRLMGIYSRFSESVLAS